MAKESYSNEWEFLGEKFRESYDIKVTDEGIEYITITDTEGRMVIPTWHLIKTLHDRIQQQLDYFEEMRQLEEEQEEEQ